MQTSDQRHAGLTTSDLVAVILAGGRGTRIQHLTANLPKPMVPVLGRPFVEWVIRHLAEQGITRVIISTGYRAEIFEAHFAHQPVEGVTVSCVAEPEPLGTAGGFLNAVRHTADRPSAWLVLNGDSMVLTPLAELISCLDTRKTVGALLGVKVPDAARFGTLDIAPDGTLLGFLEKRPGAGIINAGIYLFRNEILEKVSTKKPLSFEYDVLPQLAATRALKVSVSNAPFLDIGTPETLPLAESFLRGAQIPVHS